MNTGETMSRDGKMALTIRDGLACGGLSLWILVAGCIPANVLPGGNTGNPDDPGTQVAGAITAGEPDNTWADATLVTLPADGSITVSGSIGSAADVDVFDLGPVAAGDQLIVETQQSSALDAAAGLFDDREMALIVNDDRAYGLGRYDPYINHVIREALPHCYLVIASSPYESTTGSYVLTLTRHPGVAVPSAHGQAVLLDFNGASNVRIGGRSAINVPAFDAASIDSKYAGHTAEVVDTIEAMMRAEYAPYNVQVYSTAEGSLPTGNYSTVYFGTYDSALLGLADSVDVYDADTTDECIVYTDTFRLFMPLNPTIQQMATAVGNVATHEFGHLVGLYHTRDASEVMDITGSAQSLLVDQTLHEAPLEDSVFPIGSQDPGMLLMDALGAHL
jgi:hypothetical protein